MTRKFMNKRKELGLTQRQVAEAVGVTVQTVSNWETGLYNPKLTLEQVDKLCQVLQSDIKEVKEMFVS
ncbi:putative transcriptional regulator [Hyella patelloides LEGE 07179]|uniref:Putative transcriptional regulator n=2 Tax=Hyella TaxID=945733 RepID=A0A563VRR2_9CYAN|nr:putative transcriptional regulator [Hyella patelloides LEGE 07179]